MSAQGHAIHYVAGGTVQAGDGVYVERQADTTLLQLCRESAFAYVLTSRQMGKSSLMIRTAEKLIEEGIRPVIIDLTELGAQTSADQWYRGVVEKIAEQLELRTGVTEWWAANQHLSAAQRFNRFLSSVVLSEVPEPIVIFIDEIDTTLRLDFTDDFFGSIRYLYNARSSDKRLMRLSFVLLGVATPSDLMKDPERTPFNVGQRVDLEDFSEAEAVRDLHAAPELVHSVFASTGGHPYLTLRVFRSLAEQPLNGSGIEDRLAALFFGEQAGKDSNLQFVRDMLTKRAADPDAVLTLYQRIWRGKLVQDKEADPVRAWLRLSGIVRRSGGLLEVRNPIYRHVFDEAWIRKNKKVNWARRAAVAGVVGVALAILIAAALLPFALRQRQAAIRALAEAQEAQVEEQKQRKLAEASAAAAQLAAKNEADQAFQANLQRANAEALAKRAQAAEAEARKYAATSTARGLTTQSLLVQNTSPNQIGTSSLLSIESLLRSPSVDGMQPLQANLPLLRPMLFHVDQGQSVNAVVFSPDSRLLLTAGSDGTALIVEAQTGKELARLKHENSVLAAVFSPDGHFLATGSADRAARVFATGTGSQLFKVDYQGRVLAIAFSPDGKSVATFTADRKARTFDAQTGKELIQFEIGDAPAARGNSILFSPDGLFIGLPETGQLFDSKTGKEVTRRSPTASRDLQISSLSDTLPMAFSHDGKLLATASGNIARVLESGTWKDVSSFDLKASVVSIAFSPDGKLVAAGAGDNNVRVFESGTGKEITHFAQQGLIGSVVFSPDGQLVATGSVDTSARLFDSRTGNEVARLPHRGPLTSVAFSPNGRLLATAGADGSARVFQIWTGKEISRFALDIPAYGVAFSPDGSRVAMRGGTDEARIIAADSGKDLARLDIPLVYAIAFSPDGRWVAIAGNNILHIYNNGTWKELRSLTLANEVNALAFTTDGRLLAVATGKTGATKGDVTIFETKTWKETTRLNHDRAAIDARFSQDGRFLLTGSEDNKARIFETQTWKELAQVPHPNQVWAVAFSPDGKLFATGCVDSKVRVFDFASRKEIATLVQSNQVRSVVFNRDGQLAAGTYNDGLVRVFEKNTWKEVARLTHGGDVFHGDFSPDGRLLGVASGNVSSKQGWTSISPWKPEDLIHAACDRLTFNFTPDEWKKQFPDEPYRKTCPNLP